MIQFPLLEGSNKGKRRLPTRQDLRAMTPEHLIETHRWVHAELHGCLPDVVTHKRTRFHTGLGPMSRKDFERTLLQKCEHCRSIRLGL